MSFISAFHCIMEDDLKKLRKNYKDKKTFGKVKLEWLEPECEWDIKWEE